MLHHHTIDKLKTMKLNGMAQAFEEQLNTPSIENISFEERIGILIDREDSFRQNRKLKQLLNNAKLKYSTACVEDINYNTDRYLDKTQMTSFASCDWIKKGYNLMITGATGCGKTWIANALGNQACRLGLTTFYTKMTKLYDHLRIAEGEGKFKALLAKLIKYDLLIIDDFGLCKPTNVDRNNFLELVDDRYKKSILITSQLPVENWHEAIGEETLADAIIDRLINNTNVLKLKGESLRKTKENLTNNERS
jgi:DNA replication protein DnaC